MRGCQEKRKGIRRRKGGEKDRKEKRALVDFSRGGELREGGANGEGSENLFYPHFHSSGRVRTYCLFIYTSCFELFTPVVFLLFVVFSYCLKFAGALPHSGMF